MIFSVDVFNQSTHYSLYLLLMLQTYWSGSSAAGGGGGGEEWVLEYIRGFLMTLFSTASLLTDCIVLMDFIE